MSEIKKSDQGGIKMTTSTDYNLTEKEQAAVNQLHELAKIWPRSLSLGEDIDSDNIAVWKKGGPKDLWSSVQVASVKIKNHEVW
jgi:hypothetical protein